MTIDLTRAEERQPAPFNTTPSDPPLLFISPVDNQGQMEPPRNRKQRRAAAATASPDDFDPSVIPLAHPPRDTASKNQKDGKTLVDIISERNGNLLSGKTSHLESLDAKSATGTRVVTVDPTTGEISDFDNPGGDEEAEGGGKEGHEASQGEEGAQDQPLPAFLDTVLLSFPLTTLHLTLAYLAAYQYAAEIPLSNLLRESAFVAFPILTLLIHLAHGHIISFGRIGEGAANNSDNGVSLFPLTPEKLSVSFLRRLTFPPSPKTLVFLPLSLLLGAKLMTVTNQAPYYAVMKRAPAIGTLWVWSILEVPLGASLIGALGPLGWGAWWKGYGIF